MTESPLYGGTSTARVRMHHLQQAKERGEKWAMLTAYDTSARRSSRRPASRCMLVGDSAGNVVLGHTTHGAGDRRGHPADDQGRHPLDEARARSSPTCPSAPTRPARSRRCETAVRLMKEGGAQAVKLEGGVRVAPQIRLLVEAGIPVMAHIGFTPQSEHALGGFRVQGRGAGAEQLLADARAVQEAGRVRRRPGDGAGRDRRPR